MKTAVELQRDVLDELNWEPTVDAARIGVTVTDGVVSLVGHVQHHAEKHAAEQAAKKVHGVRVVVNEIEVAPHPSDERTDEDLAAAVDHALTWDARVPHEQLKIAVEHGKVRVEGDVEHRHQKQAIEQALGNLAGLRKLINRVKVRRIPAEEHEASHSEQIQSRVEAAYRRSAALRQRDIAVSVDRDTIVLSGDVHSAAESEEAERLAWALREISHVENCLTITPWGRGPREEWGY